MNKAIAATLRHAKKKGALPPTVEVVNVNEEGDRINNANEIGMEARMTDFLLAERKKIGRTNTDLAFDPKMLEWKEFCEYICPNDDFKTCITPDKAFKFFFYTAFREQYKKGGGKRTGAKPPKFDVEVYKKLMVFFRSDCTQLAVTHLPRPVKPIGIHTFEQYRSVLHRMLIEQQTRGTNTRAWEFVWTNNLKMLSKMVKERAPGLAKAQCKEKHNAFTPYDLMTRFEDIEDRFFAAACETSNRRALNSRLRYRLCLLLLTSTVMRSESVHRADISDFFTLQIPMKLTDVHRMDLMINQIAEGKTTHGKLQYGRAARHANVSLCAIGATVFYMMNREDVSGEFGSLTVANWMDNHHWFNRKFLVDACSSNTEKEMTNDGYATALKDVLIDLRLPTNKILHLGRNMGTKRLDCDEVDEGEIRRMGQWNQSIYDQSYSSKLPMQAIRALAGFPKENSCYNNVRTTVMPSMDLLLSLPLGFAFPMLEALEKEDVTAEKTTAMGTLKWMQFLCYVFLQDAAAMAIIYPERTKCPIYRHETLQSENFEEYKKEMAAAIKEDLENGPLAVNIDRILPGVNARLTAQTGSIRANTGAIGALSTKLDNGFDLMVQRLDGWGSAICEEQVKYMTEQMAEQTQIVGASLVNAGHRLMGGTSSPCASKNSEDTNDSDELLADLVPNGLAPMPLLRPVPLDLNLNLRPEEQPRRKEPIEKEVTTPTATVVKDRFRLKLGHNSLQAVWDEWFGVGEFAHDPDGGIPGRDKKYGKNWRGKSNPYVDNTQISRTARLIKAIAADSKNKGVQPVEVVAEWEPIFSIQCNKKVSSMVTFLKKQGMIAAKAKRGSHVAKARRETN